MQTQIQNFQLISIDLEVTLAEEIERETRKMKESLDETVEFQKNLIDQLESDQSALDSIELHVINSKENIKDATKYLEESEKNVASHVNPLKNITNIINLLSSLKWFSK